MIHHPGRPAPARRIRQQQELEWLELRSGLTVDQGTRITSGPPEDLWSDGTTLWVFSGASQKLGAFNLSTRARDSGKDVSVGSVWVPVSMTVHGSTVWVAQRNLNRLWAYSLASKARTPGKDITLHADNGDRSALWTDGTTMWVADNEDEKLYAYAVSGGARQLDKEIDFTGPAISPGALWTDGTTMWIVQASVLKPHGAFAYKLSDGTRQPGKDYDYWRDLYGMWSNGTTTWFSFRSTNGGVVWPYKAIPPTKRLEAGSITATAATLTLHWHTGNWHYKATTGPDTTCSSPAQTGTTASLSGLTAGSYTYTAYSDSTCADANAIASVTFTAGAASGAGASAQAQGGGASSGLPVLRIDASGAAAWEYTLPTGATFVSTELRWVATAGLSAADWTGAQSRSFTGASVTGHSIAGLQSGVEYKAQVTVSVTVGGAAQSAASATLVFTLPAATAALPGNVATVLAVHNGDNVSALWTGASDATGYEARYSDDNGATWTSATRAVSGHRHDHQQPEQRQVLRRGDSRYQRRGQGRLDQLGAGERGGKPVGRGPGCDGQPGADGQRRGIGLLELHHTGRVAVRQHRAAMGGDGRPGGQRLDGPPERHLHRRQRKPGHADRPGRRRGVQGQGDLRPDRQRRNAQRRIQHGGVHHAVWSGGQRDRQPEEREHRRELGHGYRSHRLRRAVQHRRRGNLD